MKYLGRGDWSHTRPGTQRHSIQLFYRARMITSYSHLGRTQIKDQDHALHATDPGCRPPSNSQGLKVRFEFSLALTWTDSQGNRLRQRTGATTRHRSPVTSHHRLRKILLVNSSKFGTPPTSVPPVLQNHPSNDANLSHLLFTTDSEFTRRREGY